MLEFHICRMLFMARFISLIIMSLYAIVVLFFVLLLDFGIAFKAFKFFCIGVVVWSFLPSKKELYRMGRYYYKKSLRQRKGL